LTGGELLIRNLMYGQQDVRRYGGVGAQGEGARDHAPQAGWLVDTFGHISQAPQIHRLFGLDAVFVWRGVPLLQPYFAWRGADGSVVLAINLFGGYRNLYGVTHAPEVAARRLQAEVRRLRPYYPTPDVPLFDGYDLEDDPEDPLRFFAGREDVGQDLALKETTPAAFAREIAQKGLALPTVGGELNSGKYGATFPGALTARTYLKVMAYDCERLLFDLAEPLAALAHLRGRPYAATQHERWGRELLQNAVHDCICGVSIDQVHEKMEDSYRRLHDAMWQDVQESLAAIVSDFRAGEYAVSTNPFCGETWLMVGDELLQVRTEGVGLWPVAERLPVAFVSRPASSFHWRNEHYEATVTSQGAVRSGQRLLGAFVVSEEQGDTYSAQMGARLGALRLTSPPRVVARSERHAVVHFRGLWRGEGAWVRADVWLQFDPSPLIRWTIELDSQGSDLRVDLLFETGGARDVHAAMPFDVVRRPPADTDLLPRELPEALSTILLGQRELNRVTNFPMHGFVAAENGEGHTTAILARGIYAYHSGEEGQIGLPLRRAVQWVTQADLQDRVGDAGPFFYVPGARCERRARHEVAVALGPFAPDSLDLQRLSAVFHNPPLIVRVRGDGERERWQLLQEDVPLSSLSRQGEAMLARFYNPLSRALPFSRVYLRKDVWGAARDTVATVAAHEILTVALPHQLPAETELPPAGGVTTLTPPSWRVGADRARPQRAQMAQLEREIAALAEQLQAVRAQVASATGAQKLRLQHHAYVLEREQLEYRLSLLLNRRKLAEEWPPGHEYLYGIDPEIAELGQALNRLRIKRRIFDYVVQAV
ncbi:MAG TPA: hypothetical protein VK879_13115, partial [Candidatus Sulfomarinibacteraceae bacterium]|nr:hypothetical protein [Candidatus Sulfomarinibacteraceae bacterium]